MQAIEFEISEGFRTPKGYLNIPIFLKGNQIISFEKARKLPRFQFKEIMGNCSSRDYVSIVLGFIPNDVKVLYFSEIFDREKYQEDKKITSQIKLIIPHDLTYIQKRTIKDFFKKELSEPKEEHLPFFDFKGIKTYDYSFSIEEKAFKLQDEFKDYIEKAFKMKIYVK